MTTRASIYVVADERGHSLLVWQLCFESARPVSPAGLVALRLPDGSQLWADYSEPEVIHFLEVPFGLLDDEIHDEGPLAPHGRFEGRSASQLEALLGAGAVSALSSAEHDEVTFDAKPSVSLELLGRAAVLRAIAKREGVPLDGLWALELATFLDRRISPDIAQLRDELIDRCRGVAAVIDDDWLRSLDPRVERDLRRKLHNVGLVEELPALSRAPEEMIDPLALLGSVGGHTLGVSDDRTLFVHYSCQGSVQGATQELKGGVLTVRIELTPSAPVGYPGVLDVRVSTNGSLVAAALSCTAAEDGRATATLRLPPGLGLERICTLIGVGLDMYGFDEAWIRGDAIEHAVRSALDVHRVGGDPTEVATHVAEAQRLLDEAVVLEPSGAFTVEHCRDTATPSGVTAADAETRRSFAYLRRDYAAVAEIELAETHRGNRPLDRGQLVRLADALAVKNMRNLAGQILDLINEDDADGS